MKLYAATLLLALPVAGCSSSDDGSTNVDAAAAIDAFAPPIDAPPSARNAKAVGKWTATTDVTVCGGFSDGLVGSALPLDNQFQLVFNEKLPNGQSPETTCTFMSDTEFTCTDINMSSVIGTCVVYGGFTNLAGTITGTAFEIAGNASGSASAQCPGGARSCGPAGSSAAGTIAP